jgi:Membrane-bound serine protease (ClpP class)
MCCLCLCSLLAWGLWGALDNRDEGKPLIYKIAIKQEIHQASQRTLVKGLQAARDAGADFIILQINTYGGAVDAADSMRTAILHEKVPVIAFIDNQAVSAGALISIACDSVYMSSGASFGSASVVNGTGQLMPEKYQSFMRSMMRATAEAHGKKLQIKDGDSLWVWHRDPAIAEAMVGSKTGIDGLIDTSQVLNFTSSEAMTHGYCEGSANSVQEVIQALGISEYEYQEYKAGFLDKLIGLLLLPIVQGLLLMMIMGGIYFELQSPGIGFPLAAAVTAAIIYFAPLYLEGMAEYWELIIVVLGVGLLLVEVFFFPGFGLAGISGAALLFTGLVLAMVDNNIFYFEGPFPWIRLLSPLAVVSLAGLMSMLMLIYFVNKFYPMSIFNKIVLRTELANTGGFVGVSTKEAELVGNRATVFADLKPAGKIIIGNKLYEAVAEYGMIEKGASVRITRDEGGRLYCERHEA